MKIFDENLSKIKNLIIKSAENKEIFDNLCIIAVTKTFSEDIVRSAIKSNFYIFGENKVQEAKIKFTKLKIDFPNIKLHMLGNLQTNKVKDALKIFDFIHTLDREKICLEIRKHQTKESLAKKFFIQVNIGNEKQKSGISKIEASDFINWCLKDLNLNIIGLMCIPPKNENSKNYFLELKELAIKNNLNKLSMGMSSDFLEAINCGATHIRLGEALFGKRSENEKR